jgi:hypothetical protein
MPSQPDHSLTLSRLRARGLVWQAGGEPAATESTVSQSTVSQLTEQQHQKLPSSIHTWPGIREQLGLLPGTTHLYLPASVGERLFAPQLLISAILSMTLEQELLKPIPSYSCVSIIGRYARPSILFVEQLLRADLRAEALRRILFIEPADTRSQFWTIQSALSSSVVPLVIADVTNLQKQKSRGLNLAAKKSEGIGLFVQKNAVDKQYAFSSLWQVQFHPPRTAKSPEICLRLELLRTKGTQKIQKNWIFSFKNKTTYKHSGIEHEDIPFSLSPLLAERSLQAPQQIRKFGTSE